MPSYHLGISAFYHDSAAVLLLDGWILAAAQEERFTRKKHDPSFPRNAIEYVLREAGISADDLDAVAFYDKPWLKFERLLETYHAFAPRGLRSFLAAMPVWIRDKAFMRRLIRKELEALGGTGAPLYFPEHHLSHAASAFYPSPYDQAAILTVDGVGEWATTTIGFGSGNSIRVDKELAFPHSLGLLYSAFTYYCGFKVNSGEYKLMGLAPYGDAEGARTTAYRTKILDELVDLREDGSLLLNMDYFDFATGLRMCRDDRWESLFGLPKRAEESALEAAHMDLALACQHVTEEAMMRMARTAQQITGARSLCMAGGVALNCVANGKLLREGPFENIWIQPAAGDAGGALGAALAAYYIVGGETRYLVKPDTMRGTYLGPGYTNADAKRVLARFDGICEYFEDEKALLSEVAALLDAGNVVGWFQGRMEYGPRALGGRSILCDPRGEDVQRRLNLKIKYREGFRPFAPSVLNECREEYFALDTDSPYMLVTAPVQPTRCNPSPENAQDMDLYTRLHHPRSDLPAITHVDYSARVQTVHRETNPRYWALLQAFRERTGCGVLVNTSFNVRGEPIVCTPDDAYRCFMRTEMDILVIEDCLFHKTDQEPWPNSDRGASAFESD